MFKSRKDHKTANNVFQVHEIMLRDRPRQNAYRDAIQQCKAQFAGKVVLDVGAGTGILSVMCAKVRLNILFILKSAIN